MKPKNRRMLLIATCILSMSAGVGLILSSFQQHLVFFYTPTELLTPGKPQTHQNIRVGGLVKEESIILNNNTLETKFKLIDAEKNAVLVAYTGLLPPLFREGQGVVAEGTWHHHAADNTENKESYFLAHTLLTKHDENYKPPALTRSIEPGYTQPSSK